MSGKKEITPFNKSKQIKFDILKRCKNIEEKYGSEKTSSFRWHEIKSIMLNLAFWKIPERGVISVDDVKTAIYQLEKDGMIELVNHDQIRLTPKGSQVAKEIRTMRIDDIPNLLLGNQTIIIDKNTKINRCPHCGKQLKVGSSFCNFCGTKIKLENEFCTYCGTSIMPGSKFCPACGKKL